METNEPYLPQDRIFTADKRQYGKLDLKGRARGMRHVPTPAEEVLWQRLRGNQLGVKFRRQHSIGQAQYSLMKVVGAGGNAVQLVANEYVTNDATPLSKLNDPEKYSKQPFPLTFLDLQVMMNKGEITDVDRLGQ